MENSKISLLSAQIAIIAILTYQVLLIALIFIRPDLEPSWHTISEWAIGRHGWIMTTAFLISALSYVAVFVLLKPHIKGILGWIGLGLLFLCIIGTIFVGVFSTDSMQTRALSTTGILHMIGGSSAMMLLPFSALFLNLSLALKNKAWKIVLSTLLWTAGIPLVGFLSFTIYHIIYVMPLGEYAYGPGVNIGWPPRFALFTYMIWVIILTTQAIKLKRLSLNNKH